MMGVGRGVGVGRESQVFYPILLILARLKTLPDDYIRLLFLIELGSTICEKMTHFDVNHVLCSLMLGYLRTFGTLNFRVLWACPFIVFSFPCRMQATNVSNSFYQGEITKALWNICLSERPFNSLNIQTITSSQ